MLTVTSLKVVITISVFLSSFLSVLAPRWIIAANESLFSIGNMMASGVLLAAGLTHQLADATESLTKEDGEYPYAMLICGLTFIGFLTLEESIHLLLAGVHDHNVTIPEEVKHNHSSEILHGLEHDHSPEGQPLLEKQDKLEIETEVERTVSYCSDHQHRSQSNGFSISEDSTHLNQHHHHDDHISKHLHGSLVAALILLLALSIHSILEGVAVGIVETLGEVSSTSLAIIAHKVFASYALGSAMVNCAEEGMDRKRHMILGLVFACMTPLGIVIGMVADDFLSGSNVAVGIVQASVAGTFLYVAIIEVGMKELLICRHDERLGKLAIDMSVKQIEAMKLLFFLLGFLAMSGLAYFV